jgi:hypothetical protein
MEHNPMVMPSEKGREKAREKAEAEVRHLFHGDVLKDREDFKLFLKDAIERHTRIRIHDTRLIHRYDPLSNANVHKYIDFQEQIVMVIRLVNGFCIAGYYEGAFIPKKPADR